MNFFPESFDISKYVHTRKYSIDVFNDSRVIVNFSVFAEEDNFTFSEGKTQQYLKELILILESFTQNRKSVINVHFYEHKEIRTLSHLKPGDKTTPNEINGGLCYLNSKETDINIVVFRSEEFYKVLCHEFIHLYDIQPNNRDLEEHVKKLFPSENLSLKINESIVEVHAVIFNCMIVSILKDEQIKDLINQEYLFSLFQTFKLLDHYKITTFTIEEINEKWTESTHTFSYVVFKTFLFHILLSTIPEIQIKYNQFDFSVAYSNSLRLSIVEY